jgi:hypothetical protein
MAETWQETLEHIDAGVLYTVRCPDGVERRIWGSDRGIGAIFISDYDRDAWMDCSSGVLRVEFD